MKINDSTQKRKTNLRKTRVWVKRNPLVITAVVAVVAGEMQGAEQVEPGETAAAEE